MSFSRAALAQTGDGHFSPLGGYHAASDSLLVLDAAKFKYPPYWCALPAMWRAMQATDWETGRPRAYIVCEGDGGGGGGDNGSSSSGGGFGGDDCGGGGSEEGSPPGPGNEDGGRRIIIPGGGNG